jgi:hypothetical protein
MMAVRVVIDHFESVRRRTTRYRPEFESGGSSLVETNIWTSDGDTLSVAYRTM